MRVKFEPNERYQFAKYIELNQARLKKERPTLAQLAKELNTAFKRKDVSVDDANRSRNFAGVHWASDGWTANNRTLQRRVEEIEKQLAGIRPEPALPPMRTHNVPIGTALGYANGLDENVHPDIQPGL